MVDEQDKSKRTADSQQPEPYGLHCKETKRIKIETEPTTSDDKSSAKSRQSHLYENKIILAPMVRANSLPFRLLCLQNGADLVYSEELIDHRVVTCKRVENLLLGTIDLVDKDGRVIFRTCEEERGKIVLQLGSNDPERALKAAKLISQDVMGIDFNFGCPKKFSIAGGMGAALLEEPEKIRALLTTCVRELDIPVTCKMRLLPRLDDTISLVKLIESCGVSAIAVHGRTKDQRPAHDNDVDTLKIIAETISIPLIANGESNNIKTYEDIMKFREKTKASSVMIGRIAMKNPAVFHKPTEIVAICPPSDTKDSETHLSNSPTSRLNDTMLESSNKSDYNNANDNVAIDDDKDFIVKEYVRLAVKYDNHPSNVKYSLQSLMSSGDNRASTKGIAAKLHRATTMEAICELFQLPSSLSKTAKPMLAESNKGNDIQHH